MVGLGLIMRTFPAWASLGFGSLGKGEPGGTMFGIS